MRDKIIGGSAGLILTLLGFLASALYDSMQEKMNENRDSIQALIDIHLKQ